MDPDAARQEILELANQTLAEVGKPAPDDGTVERLATELAEKVHELDVWLRGGGFMPTAWMA